MAPTFEHELAAGMVPARVMKHDRVGVRHATRRVYGGTNMLKQLRYFALQ